MRYKVTLPFNSPSNAQPCALILWQPVKTPVFQSARVITFSWALITSSVKAWLSIFSDTHIILTVLCLVYLKTFLHSFTDRGKTRVVDWLIFLFFFIFASCLLIPVTHFPTHKHRTFHMTKRLKAFKVIGFVGFEEMGVGAAGCHRDTWACMSGCVPITLKRQWELITVAERESRMREQWR